MSLKPVNFAVPNSKTLKILFNQDLSSGINIDNFKIKAVEGG